MKELKHAAAWHIHHDILWGWLTEPIENRIAFIKANEPVGEIETRLRLMVPVKNMPQALVDALAAYKAVQRPAWEEYAAVERPAWAAYAAVERPAWAAYEAVEHPAWVAYETVERPVRAAYEAVKREHEPVMLALHATECGCSFFENGNSIFKQGQNA